MNLFADVHTLAELAAQRKLAVILGPTISNIAGVLSWEESVRPLAPDGDTEMSSAELVSYYCDSHPQGERLLEDQLRETLRDAGDQFSFIAALLKTLNPVLIIDITHSPLLEVSFARIPAGPYRLLTPEVVEPVDPSATTICKPLGSTNNGGALVVSGRGRDVAFYTPMLSELASIDVDGLLVLADDLSDVLYSSAFEQIVAPLARKCSTAIVALASAPEVPSRNHFAELGFRPIVVGDGPADAADSYAKLVEEILIGVRQLTNHLDGSGAALQAWQRYGNDTLSTRLGTGLSLQVKEEHIDREHRYDLIFRQDLLDYGTGDFFSIRRLRGRNVTDRLSSGLTYVESTEEKCFFRETGVTAFESETRRQLRVESATAEAAFTHPFRIMFARPIAPRESFDITYAIRLPRELEALSSDKEKMSISLARIGRGIDELVFNVALNFEPGSVSVMCLDSAGVPVACGGSAPRVEEYVPVTWEEDYFDIEWTSKTRHIIRWRCRDPSSVLYIIEYMR